MTRAITHHYDDPLDRIWLAAAREVGWEVRRASDAYASFDGRGTLTITTPDAFDADDSLAQMVLHELCHALVAGPDAARRPDFGLENADDRDLVQEHAVHRLQAALAGRWGLRRVFAVTTDWRPYWDALPDDPLGPGRDPALALARAAFARAAEAPYEPALRRAFVRTRAVIDACRDALPSNHLLALADPPRVHALGVPAGPRDARCATCAWFVATPTRLAPGHDAPDPTRDALARRPDDARLAASTAPPATPSSSPPEPRGRCLRHATPQRRPRVTGGTLACHAWEPRLTPASCLACGACCREAFHLVPVEARSPLHHLRPDWIRRDGAFGPYLPRPEGRCVALGARTAAPWVCDVYEDRPRSCRDFTASSANCLEARRRCGLS
jgi:hypothetical protein